jgi:hypothetical protein
MWKTDSEYVYCGAPPRMIVQMLCTMSSVQYVRPAELEYAIRMYASAICIMSHGGVATAVNVMPTVTISSTVVRNMQCIC